MATLTSDTAWAALAADRRSKFSKTTGPTRLISIFKNEPRYHEKKYVFL